MEIYDKLPSDWRDLEIKVAQVLHDAGYITEIERTVTTVRGTVNIDVYAEDQENQPNSIYLCECKYWEKDINQSVVHAFRTVVQDYGANYGILIAKNGFQSGAIETARNTNIKLLRWGEFLKVFEERWLRNKIEWIYAISEPLMDYVDFTSTFFDDEFRKLSKEQKELFKLTSFSYIGIAHFASCKYILMDFTTGKINKVNLDSQIEQAKSFLQEYSISCYDNYYKALRIECEKGISSFDKLFGKPIRRGIV